MLPPSPQIFHGRESELQHIVKILMEDSPRIAILGAGGMGKTSLSTTALHHPEVEAKYPHRHFIPCHLAPTSAQLVSTIADYIGVEKGTNLSRKVVNYFTHAPPTLLILDNLETAWEPHTSRSEVEEFLSLLTDIVHVALMVSISHCKKIWNDLLKFCSGYHERSRAPRESQMDTTIS
jgi:Cdc6-like AAA superfamily ATPase